MMDLTTKPTLGMREPNQTRPPTHRRKRSNSGSPVMRAPAKTMFVIQEAPQATGSSSSSRDPSFIGSGSTELCELNVKAL